MLLSRSQAEPLHLTHGPRSPYKRKIAAQESGAGELRTGYFQSSSKSNAAAFYTVCRIGISCMLHPARRPAPAMHTICPMAGGVSLTSKTDRVSAANNTRREESASRRVLSLYVSPFSALAFSTLARSSLTTSSSVQPSFVKSAFITGSTGTPRYMLLPWE